MERIKVKIGEPFEIEYNGKHITTWKLVQSGGVLHCVWMTNIDWERMEKFIDGKILESEKKT